MVTSNHVHLLAADDGEITTIARSLQKLGLIAKGRKAVEAGEAYQLREPQVSYLIDFGPTTMPGAVQSQHRAPVLR